MIRLFDYIAFRIFEYYTHNKNLFAKDNTVNFIVILQGTMLVPIFLILHLFFEFNPKVFGDDHRIKYYIGIPLGLILLYLNGRVYKKKLNGIGLEKLHQTFYQENYKLPIWVIFISPVIFAFVCPILYGAINGTLRFPLFE